MTAARRVAEDSRPPGAVLLGLQSIDGVDWLRSDLLLDAYKMSHDWSRQLLNPDDTDIDISVPPHCDPSHLDEHDRAVLAAMADDGRTSFRTIANSLGSTKVWCDAALTGCNRPAVFGY